MAKKIPYAVANYEKIVNEGFHFVDKTRFIRELEKYQVPVFLRPRRFGKSLWCSVLECYYDVNRRERFATLFAGTDIGREPTPAHNQYLVVRFDFSTISVGRDLESIEKSFQAAVTSRIRLFVANYGIPEGELNLSLSAADILRDLLSITLRRGLPPIYLIIDEYDNFTNQLITTHQDQLYGELTSGDSFLRTFFKVIKAGIGDGSIAHTFITGVLPVTMDDLTSGFNIAQIITLEEHTLEMMGFTQTEVESYVDAIFAEHDWPLATRQKVRDDLRSHYNGYRLLPEATETLYNSTICNFYLSKLVIGNGKIPSETIDDNLRVDVNWLRRLTGGEAETRELLEQLMFNGTLPVDLNMLRAKFNMRQFFQKDFYPLSLYYLGMLTFRDDFTLCFPNLTGKTIFTEYFNELFHISVSLGYTEMFQQFLRDHDLGALFAGYWTRYIGQVPAQAFDQANENFFRTTFYELCTRYLSRYLSFTIEANHPSGRSDWEALGRPNGPFANQAYLLEFKHFSRAEAARLEVAHWSAPRPDDVAQIEGYAASLQAKHPGLSIRRHLVYTTAGSEFRCFAL